MLIWALIIALVSPAVAQSPKPVGEIGFKSSYIGEGGAYVPPGREATDAMETVSRRQGGNGTHGPIRLPGIVNPIVPDPARGPSAAAPIESAGPASDAVKAGGRASSPASGKVLLGEDARRPAAAMVQRSRARGEPPSSLPSVAVKAAAERPDDRRRYSLWEGLQEPLELPPVKANEVGLDEAVRLGRKDYDTHILSSAGEVLPGEDRAAPVLASGARVRSQGQAGRIFVSFDLDVKPQLSRYRDALAELSRAARFVPDPRFKAQESPDSGAVAIWGWMPADKIGAAAALPAVRRLQIEPALTPGHSAGKSADMLVGVRVGGHDGGEPPRAALERVLRELAGEAKFSWKRTIGYQLAPRTQDLVFIVQGEVPLADLSRLMAHPAVIKILPSPDPEVALDAAEIPPRPGAPRDHAARFFSFIAAEAPWLVLLTVLTAISTLGSGRR